MKKLYLLTVFFVSAFSFAQNFKLGNVTVDELKETKSPIVASAPAAILYKKGTTSFDFDSQGHWIITTDVAVRLKIYNKDGYKYATVEVPYYEAAAGREEVYFSDVITYNLSGGKIEKTKLTDESELTEKTNNKWKTRKVVLPNVKEGSVIEYHYVIKTPLITSFRDWYFQYDIPVNEIEYSAHIPLFFTYNRILSPYVAVKETTETKKQTKRYSDSNTKGGYGQSTSVAQTQTGSLEFYETRRTYTAKNVLPMSNEGYVDNIANYRSFVKHELASTLFPNQPEKKYATDWNTVAKSIYGDLNFGKEIGYTDYYEKDLNELLKNKTQRGEIISLVFDYVKNRMTWNEEYGYDCVDGVKKAYANKTGNVADINLMLLSMLRYAGLNASPVLLSTRDNGHVTFVNRDQFNYVIVGVEAQNGIVYLDATSKNAMPNILPVRDLNGTARVIRENLTSTEVDITPVINSKESTMVISKIGTDGLVTGQVKTQLYDYNAYRYRENNLKLSKESYTEKLEKKLENIVISNLEISNGQDFTQPIVESFVFESKNLCDVIGDKIYVSPMLFYTMAENPFKQESRSYPIDFVFPHQDKYVITIAIPEGYTVESIPQPVLLGTRDNVVTFKFNIAVNQANQIQISVINDINFARVNPEYYETIKEFYAGMVKKQTEKIVLVKK